MTATVKPVNKTLKKASEMMTFSCGETSKLRDEKNGFNGILPINSGCVM
jgi:hypothetical protein